VSSGTGVFVRFCIVGVIGFVADSGVTILLTQAADWTPFPARVAAFVAAATVTWTLNRRYTFRCSVGAATWLLYMLVTAVGAIINIGVYLAWLQVVGADAVYIFAGVGLGSIAALSFNFFVSRAFVFRGGSVDGTLS
jgi:putative flippase GtrA